MIDLSTINVLTSVGYLISARGARVNITESIWLVVDCVVGYTNVSSVINLN